MSEIFVSKVVPSAPWKELDPEAKKAAIEKYTEKYGGTVVPIVPRETLSVAHETIQQKKEETVDKETIKTGILRVLGRKGAMSISAMKNFAANRASKEEYQAALDELARTGKINTKQGLREGSLIAWVPGAAPPGPAGGEKKPTAPTALGAAKRQRNVKQRQTDKSSRVPAVSGSPPPKKGGGRTSASGLQFRGTDWIDLNAGRPVFGVQAKYDGRYLNCAEDGVPLFFDSEAERDAWLRERRVSE